jgi:hypothetical protein
MNYSTRDPRPVSRDPVPQNAGISREFVVKSVLAPGTSRSAVQIQAGVAKIIRIETIIPFAPLSLSEILDTAERKREWVLVEILSRGNERIIRTEKTITEEK